MELDHATCVAIDGAGVLLRGASGAGKSDLALRLIDAGAALVADDRVWLEAAGGRLTASAPEATRGLLEVWGLGILRLAWVSPVPVALAVALDADWAGERLPGPRHCHLAGATLPEIAVDAARPSAAARVRLALRTVLDGRVASVAGALGDLVP